MSESTFIYEPARLANLMREYSKLKTIGECRVWASQAHAVVTYIRDAITKTDQFIRIEEDQLEQEQNKAAQTNLRINLMQRANFRHILERQLGQLTKIIDSLPNGTDDNEKVKLPRRQVYAVRLNGAGYKKHSFLKSLLIMILAIAIIALLLMYLSRL